VAGPWSDSNPDLPDSISGGDDLSRSGQGAHNTNDGSTPLFHTECDWVFFGSIPEHS